MIKAPPTLSDIEAARRKLSPFLPVTPLTQASGLSAELGREIFCKWDNQLRSGAFKERGALFFLLNLTPEQLSRGVCAASAGNHALALSMHAQRLGAPCHLVMPLAAPLVKVERCRSFGARIEQLGTLYECLEYASQLSQREGYSYVHPYDDPLIVTGQGVAGLELLEQCHDFDSVVIPIGGGGYAAGIATAIKAKRPDVFILGVCSEWATRMRSMQASIHSGAGYSGAGHSGSAGQVASAMTIADGIAVKTIGKITGPILDCYVDQIVSVSEESIARAIVMVLEQEHTVIEGAAAAGVAALIDGHLPSKYKRPALFICGSNIDTNLLSRLIEFDMAERGRLTRVRITLPDRPGSLHQIAGIIAATGANILQVNHDRSYARLPGYVEITVMMEVRDRRHAEEVVEKLIGEGMRTEVA